MDLGTHIRILRARRKQKAVANAAGIPQAHLSQIELGKITDPKLSTLRAVANGLGITLAELVDPENARPDAAAKVMKPS